jgi:hypothetical protein
VASGETGQELSALLSGRAVDPASGARSVKITSGEWLDRWRRSPLRSSRLFQWGGSPETLRLWHRAEAARCLRLEDLDGQRWHLERLPALGESVDREVRNLQDEYVRSWRFAAASRPWKDYRAFEEFSEEDRAHLETEALSAPLFRCRGSYVDFIPQFSRNGTHNAVGFAARTIRATRTRRLKALFGSDDGLRIWLNGARVYEVLEIRPAVPDQSSVILDLAEGANRLFIELYQAWSFWGLYLRLEDAATGEKLRLTDEGELLPLR